MKWHSTDEEGFPSTDFDEHGHVSSVYLCFCPNDKHGELFFFTAWYGKWVYVTHQHEPMLAEELFGFKVTHYIHRNELKPRKPRKPRKRRAATSIENAP